MSSEPTYTLTLNSAQAKEIRHACELLFRLKLGQFEELTRALISLDDDSFLKKQEEAKPYLRILYNIYYGDKEDTKWKDKEWYRLYNIVQAVRYAIHEAEHPNSKGVDSTPPMQFTAESVPKCEWKKNEI